MYISRIKLRNWKNFKNVETALDMRVFLIGPNAAGKSNLLDAFRFLRDVANVGIASAAVDLRGGVSAIRCLAAREYSSIEVEVDVRTGEDVLWRYRLEFNQDNLKRPEVRTEVVQKNGVTLLDRPGDEDRSDPLLRTQTALQQISENRSFRELADFFKSITYQNLLPQVVRDPRGFSPTPVQNDPYGRDFLLRVWRTTPKTRDARLNRIREALQSAVPQLADLKVEMDSATGTPHLIGVYSHWRPRGARQNESQFSDGTLRLLGLLWTVFEGSGPLLLEEPEMSLHPEIVRRLPGIFSRLSRARKEPRQIVISTHSEEMLSDQGVGPEEVLRLEPSADGTLFKQADEADKQAMRAGLTAADVLMPKAAPTNIQQLTLEF